MQDAYMDVGGRTTQETKSSNCRDVLLTDRRMESIQQSAYY
jgi:hypothetical protein